MLELSIEIGQLIRKKRKEPLDDITFHILDNYKNIATI